MDTPELTTLRAREFTEKFPSIEGDPNHEQLGQAGLVAAAATSVSTIEHREPEPGPLPTSLDKKCEELQAMMTAVQTTLGDRSAAAQTTLEDRLTCIENSITTMREEFKAFKITFGQWSRPFAQRYNRECFLGTGFQPVPYPNGELPDEATMARLRSRSSILNLDNETLVKICTMYGIKYPKRVAHRDPAKMKQDLLNHLHGDFEQDQVDEPEGEDEEEEADNRE